MSENITPKQKVSYQQLPLPLVPYREVAYHLFDAYRRTDCGFAAIITAFVSVLNEHLGDERYVLNEYDKFLIALAKGEINNPQEAAQHFLDTREFAPQQYLCLEAANLQEQLRNTLEQAEELARAAKPKEPVE